MSVKQEGHLVKIEHASGAVAVIHLTGALIVSWRASDAVERLYTSKLTPWTDQFPVPRGGIPVCFPQFGRPPTPQQVQADPALKPLTDARNIQHGFGKTVPWTVDEYTVDKGVPTVCFRLDPPTSLPLTTVRYVVTLDAVSLSMRLAISLDGAAKGALKVKPGLHPYFLVRRNEARIEGLNQGLRWLDGTKGGVEGVWPGGDVSFDDQTGSGARSWETPGGCALFIRDGGSSFKMRYSGFSDVTFWNTGTEAGTFARGEDFTDMEREDGKRFVCIEPSFRSGWQELHPGDTLETMMACEVSS